MNVLFVEGIPDSKNLDIIKIYKDGNYKYGISGMSNLRSFLKNEKFKIFSKKLDTEMEQELIIPKVRCIFNEISDADSHRVTLKKLNNLLKKSLPNMHCFNRPKDILKTTRDGIYQGLQGIDKLNVPKTIRINPKSPDDIHNAIANEGFEYPVIFRKAGDHGGKSTLRIDNDKEQFYAFALNGDDYYLTQYVDFADDQGIYQKIRLVVVDKEIYIRGVLCSNNWMVHHRSRLPDGESEKIEAEVLNSFEKKIKPKIKKSINEISNRLGLDFYGIDCNIDKDMNILLFEANASMTVLAGSERKTLQKPFIDKIKNALIEMIVTKSPANK